jgi:hypothetical protein
VHEADASASDSRKASEVLGVDTERHAGAGLRTQRFHYCVARSPENLDLRRRVERFGVGRRGALTDNAHVKLHRRGIPEIRDQAAQIADTLISSRVSNRGARLAVA